MKITLRGGPYDGRTLSKPTMISSTVNLVVAERDQGEPSFSVYIVLGDEANYVRRSDLPFGGFYVSVAMLDQRDPFGTSAHEAIENFTGPVPPDLGWREYLYDEPVELTALREVGDDENA
jgi:hypothetical protein